MTAAPKKAAKLKNICFQAGRKYIAHKLALTKMNPAAVIKSFDLTSQQKRHSNAKPAALAAIRALCARQSGMRLWPPKLCFKRACLKAQKLWQQNHIREGQKRCR